MSIQACEMPQEICILAAAKLQLSNSSRFHRTGICLQGMGLANALCYMSERPIKARIRNWNNKQSQQQQQPSLETMCCRRVSTYSTASFVLLMVYLILAYIQEKTKRTRIANSCSRSSLIMPSTQANQVEIQIRVGHIRVQTQVRSARKYIRFGSRLTSGSPIAY